MYIWVTTFVIVKLHKIVYTPVVYHSTSLSHFKHGGWINILFELKTCDKSINMLDLLCSFRN